MYEFCFGNFEVYVYVLMKYIFVILLVFKMIMGIKMFFKKKYDIYLYMYVKIK